MSVLIAGKDCEKCKYCTLDESNSARIKVECSAKNKTYYWGQAIPSCEFQTRKDEE